MLRRPRSSRILTPGLAGHGGCVAGRTDDRPHTSCGPTGTACRGDTRASREQPAPRHLPHRRRSTRRCRSLLCAAHASPGLWFANYGCWEPASHSRAASRSTSWPSPVWRRSWGKPLPTACSRTPAGTGPGSGPGGRGNDAALRPRDGTADARARMQWRAVHRHIGRLAPANPYPASSPSRRRRRSRRRRIRPIRW